MVGMSRSSWGHCVPTDNEWHAGAWHSNQEQAAFEDEGAEALERPVGHFDAADGGNQHVLQSEQNKAWEQWSRAEWSEQWSSGKNVLYESAEPEQVLYECPKHIIPDGMTPDQWKIHECKQPYVIWIKIVCGRVIPWCLLCGRRGECRTH